MTKTFLLCTKQQKEEEGKHSWLTTPLSGLISTCKWKCFLPKMLKGHLQRILQAELLIEPQREGDLAPAIKGKDKYYMHIY